MKKKFDDYYNNGLVELARVGNLVSMNNNMTPTQHELMKKSISDKYDSTKEKIDSLVMELREKVVHVNPLELLNYLSSMNYMIMMNKMSESEFTGDENMQMRCVEYIQSILVSAPNYYDGSETNEEEYVKILNLSNEIYNSIWSFYLQWSFKYENEFSNEEMEYIMQSQLASFVRGTQYQEFRIPMIQKLLEPHEETISEVYGISLEEIIAGLTVMEKNLSSGRLDAFNLLAEHMDGIKDFSGEISDEYLEQGRNIVFDAVGVGLFEINVNTGWPDLLINDLSYELGENKDFLLLGEYAGWPIINLPTERKPFIRIGEKSYCFDYYVLFDYFYRSFQRSLTLHVEDKDKWGKIQGHACENIVGTIFGELLPGCQVHLSNHYPIGKKDNAENDILIEYKDVLIIAEVKAGAYTYTPAMTDLLSHIKSIKTLVEKAENQCLRVKNYIEKGGTVKFYKSDDLAEETFCIDSNSYSQIYMLDVTVADFNIFAAQMEKIKIANAKQDIIIISLNDLWVYKEYFDSSFEFIHFLKQRTLATRSAAVSVNDELDHLGLYIEHNMYYKQAEELANGMQVFFDGYREELDKYFSIQHMGKHCQKPKQKFTKSIEQLSNICKQKDGKDVVRFTNLLLDMSGEFREIFDSGVWNLARRELELGRMLPAIGFGEISYMFTILQDGIEIIDRDKQREYVLANLAVNGKEECCRMELIMKDNNIVDVNFEFLSQEDISESKREQLINLGNKLVSQRIEQFRLQQNKKKIYPNDTCPCGSGRKYKRCCGRK